MRADVESSCIESCTDCWHHWLGSLCGQAAGRTSRASCCATSSLCCTDRTTDQPSPTRTEPARRHRGAPRPATGTGQPLRPSASLACSAPPLTSASAVAGPHAVARPHQIRFAIPEIRYSLLVTDSKIVEIATILDFRTDPVMTVAWRPVPTIPCRIVCNKASWGEMVWRSRRDTGKDKRATYLVSIRCSGCHRWGKAPWGCCCALSDRRKSHLRQTLDRPTHLDGVAISTCVSW